MDDVDEVPKESWPKDCSCGASYDEDHWEALRYVGVQKSSMQGYPDLEMRNCAKCNSTLCVVGPELRT